MNLKRALLLMVTMVLTGCVTPPPAGLVDIKKTTPLTELAALPVRCPPEIWTRVEVMTMMGMRYSFKTGEVFTTAFNGTRKDQPVIEIVESSLTGKITDLGFTALVTYKATIAITVKGVRHELKAENTHAAHGFEMPATQVKIAVENVVADLYRQIKPLL